MHPIRRILTVAATLAISVPLFGVPAAHASTPDNDQFENATVITSLPFHDTLDVSDATHEDDDPYCYSPPGHTVWYSYTPTVDTLVDATTFRSAFPDAFVTVWTGTRGDLTAVTCGFNVAEFLARAGTTYYLLAGTWFFEDEPGILQLDVVGMEVPPPLEAQVHIDTTGTVNPKTGQVTINGTLECNSTAWGSLTVSVWQRVGRFQASGSAFVDVACDAGEATTWTATISSSSAVLFGSGKVEVTASGWAENMFESRSIDTSATVRLRPRQ